MKWSGAVIVGGEICWAATILVAGLAILLKPEPGLLLRIGVFLMLGMLFNGTAKRIPPLYRVWRAERRIAELDRWRGR